MGDDQDTRTSHDPSRHPGYASTSTPPRGRDAAVPEDPEDSATITKTAALWIIFPVACVAILIVLLVAVFS